MLDNAQIINPPTDVKTVAENTEFLCGFAHIWDDVSRKIMASCNDTHVSAIEEVFSTTTKILIKTNQSCI